MKRRRRASATRWHPGTVAEEVRRELDRFDGAGAMPEVVAAWPGAVGPAIAENAWPARTSRDGTLHVAAASSVWAFELTQLEGTIQERLRDRLGARAPKRLRFAVGRLPERGAEDVKTPSRTVPEVLPEHRRRGDEIAAEIEAPGLREAVARAAAASLARGGADRPF